MMGRVCHALIFPRVPGSFHNCGSGCGWEMRGWKKQIPTLGGGDESRILYLGHGDSCASHCSLGMFWSKKQLMMVFQEGFSGAGVVLLSAVALQWHLGLSFQHSPCIDPCWVSAFGFCHFGDIFILLLLSEDVSVTPAAFSGCCSVFQLSAAVLVLSLHALERSRECGRAGILQESSGALEAFALTDHWASPSPPVPFQRVVLTL